MCGTHFVLILAYRLKVTMYCISVKHWGCFIESAIQSTQLFYTKRGLKHDWRRCCDCKMWKIKRKKRKTNLTQCETKISLLRSSVLKWRQSKSTMKWRRIEWKHISMITKMKYFFSSQHNQYLLIVWDKTLAWGFSNCFVEFLWLPLLFIISSFSLSLFTIFYYIIFLVLT